MPRGRPRKTTPRKHSAEIANESDTKPDTEKKKEDPKLSVSENRAEHDLRTAKEDSAQRKSKKETDKWYEQRGNKIILVRKFSNNNIYRSFYCRSDKDKEAVKRLESKGLLRHS